MAPPRAKTERESIRKSDMDAKPQAQRKHPDQPLPAKLADVFTDDELQTIPIIPEGQRLQQGGVYIDLNDDNRREFTATGDMIAAAGRRITSKSEVPYAIWNRLIGVQRARR